jgi:ribonuclease R
VEEGPFMADKVGDEYEGYITGVAPFGLFIELIEHYVEGLVHISSMADDYYRFVEQQHVLRGENTKKVYRLGDKVRVQVVRVDMERRQVELGLVEILDTVRRERASAWGAAQQDESEKGNSPRGAARGEAQAAARTTRTRSPEKAMTSRLPSWRP